MAAPTREALLLLHDMMLSDVHAILNITCQRRTGATLQERRARKTTRLRPPRWRAVDIAPDAMPADCRNPAPI